MTITVEIRTGNGIRTADAETGTTVAAVLRGQKLPFSMPCGGNHTCGKCKVRLSGAVSPLSPDEEKFLSRQEIADGIRLACFARVEGNCTVETVESEETARVLSAGTGRETAAFRYQKGYGFAVDIGTTTVVSYLYRLSDGDLLNVQSGVNAQRGFGADVISRINFSNEHGVAPLRKAILEQLNGMFRAACSTCAIPVGEVCEAVVTGNTTMLHYLTGLDPQGIAVYPFTPESLFGERREAGFFEALPAAAVTLPGCISSYVGADITCAILAGRMMERETVLLLDLGTNGEMALKDGDRLYCCSTAAGPAFEGAGMRMGMTAVDGAISRVWNENETVKYSVLGGGKPAGICGSGIIDAAAVFVRLGLIDETGRIDEEHPLYPRYGVEFEGFPALRIADSDIVVTQEDVRKLQLAKSAIAAGIETMLAKAGRTADEISVLYLAGGFGSYVDKESAVGIGLFPAVLKDRVTVIGNGAGTGASMLLLDAEAEQAENVILSRAEEIPLSADPVFMDYYVEKMMF